MLKITTITVYSLVAISFQTAQFALTLRSSQPCQWYYFGPEVFLVLLANMWLKGMHSRIYLSLAIGDMGRYDSIFRSIPTCPPAQSAWDN